MTSREKTAMNSWSLDKQSVFNIQYLLEKVRRVLTKLRFFDPPPTPRVPESSVIEILRSETRSGLSCCEWRARGVHQEESGGRGEVMR